MRIHFLCLHHHQLVVLLRYYPLTPLALLWIKRIQTMAQMPTTLQSANPMKQILILITIGILFALLISACVAIIRAEEVQDDEKH